ncbi:uncharacterized protein LOC128471631 isoform X2 [Spea bombifrons]|uniref:uncharacterized protein LOC128471631 isoform X2 n=1 Tax=Spea bombifrons TaxID=233779 RepID=UPI00234B114A|nr:uncharacterized protein LOC128471631 isoform X2 [Spea bombifrons]
MALYRLQRDGALQPQIMESEKEDLMFEGFLQKRKDTMKFTWARYWFKLQNTTLYFYLTGDSQSMSLRGQYYMSSVQSVRKAAATENEFTFEIVMKNGKRKLLAADTAPLRDVWMEFLWKAMQLPGPGRHASSCTWYDIPGLLQRAEPRAGVHSLALNASPGGAAQDEMASDGDDEKHIYDVPRAAYRSCLETRKPDGDLQTSQETLQ